MSGIYFVVWDDADGAKPTDERILRTTKGGYPHITIAYTGNIVSLRALYLTAVDFFCDGWLMREVTLTRAYVNSFQLKDGTWRHDCLLAVDDETSEAVRKSREKLIAVFPQSSEFSMHEPHVTVGIYQSVEEAESHAAILNGGRLPLTVKVTGMTCD